ncbi:MarR family winged helix-turn-helix transcriptional regulator [Amycolatopsis sp. NBC_00355]|uniref:MarR family winged helix-turn-helix transcriptional regulator n=1 Tax=Amycolatopsis sp. NBC_00355 TaxID=2975957 RepID=UPI002E26F266
MKPLGWWLRHVHELLESSMARALEPESLTRRQWQVLNTIALGARTPAEIDVALAPFGSTSAQLGELRERGWVAETGELTGEGREAHARVEARVEEFRTSVTEGVSDDDYRTTIRTLERCAANLEPA